MDEDSEENTDNENTEVASEVASETAEEAIKQPAKEPKKKTRYTKQEKKLVRRKAAKTEQSSNLPAILRLAVESGKVEFGSNNAIKDSRSSNTKLLIIAQNAPQQLKESINRYSALSSLPVIEFNGTSIELGSVCGKPYPVSVLSVHDAGSSNLLDFAKTKKV